MEQQGVSPIAKAGALVNNDWADYKTPQEFHNASAAALEISVEAGEAGEPGEPGEVVGPKYFGMVLETTIPIPALVTNLATGVDLNGKILVITAPNGHSTLDEEVFTVGVVEDGTVHFLFAKDEGSSPAVARAGWSLEVWTVGEVDPP